jgi:predicted secreted Zn-dependent protease
MTTRANAHDDAYNCVKAKRAAQKRIADQIEGLSRREQVDFFRREAATGELGAWWKQIREGRASKSSSDAE